jgi:putative transposase
MSERTKPPGMPSATALLRHAVLAQVQALILGGCASGAAVRQVAAREHAGLDGNTLRVSSRTIQRWRAAYDKHGITGIEPRSRRRTETAVKLSAELIEFVRQEKKRDPRASVPELVRRARLRGVVGNDVHLARSTVWRACRRMSLETRWRPGKREGDMRRWSYPLRMQCVLADGKHFRAGAGRLRRVALFFLDDATRFALDVVVGTSESTALFMRGLHGLVRHHGLPELLYLDRGPGFISADTLAVVEGGLGGWLIHGKARYPAGRGAIERFIRTAHERLLRSLDGAANVDADCAALTLRLRHFLGQYNDTPHETLGGETPAERWTSCRPLRFPKDEADLYRRFVVRETRKVSPDHVIKLDGRLWEAPRGLGAQSVDVVRHVLDGRLWVRSEGRLIELAELDPHGNAREQRGQRPPPLPSEGTPTTAASLAFDQDIRPLVGPDGGFSDQPSKDDEITDLEKEQ